MDDWVLSEDPDVILHSGNAIAASMTKETQVVMIVNEGIVARALGGISALR